MAIKTVCVFVLHTVADSREWGPPPSHIYSTSRFFPVRIAYTSLFAYPVSDNWVDTLYSALPPFQNFWILHWLDRLIGWADDHEVIHLQIFYAFGGASFSVLSKETTLHVCQCVCDYSGRSVCSSQVGYDKGGHFGWLCAKFVESGFWQVSYCVIVIWCYNNVRITS